MTYTSCCSLLSAAVLLLGTAIGYGQPAQACDNCEDVLGDNEPVTYGEINTDGGKVRFTSRSRKQSDGAYSYRYCVHNTDSYRHHAKWYRIDSDEHNKLFNNGVYNGCDKSEDSTSSKLLNGPIRNASIGPNEDSISKAQSIDATYSTGLLLPKIWLAQFSFNDSDSTPLSDVLADPNLLAKYLDQFKKLSIGSSTSFDIPVNENIANLIADGKYLQYDPSDFINIQVKRTAPLRVETRPARTFNSVYVNMDFKKSYTSKRKSRPRIQFCYNARIECCFRCKNHLFVIARCRLPFEKSNY